MLTEECAGQFDPALVAAFRAAAPQFDQAFQQHPR
jgi:HD-GYP domain-containing protein (c-di-GMP phosphodiesterase class II)